MANARVEEFCQGNKVISIRGSRTTIADYDRGELTEIDREAGTFSIARFDEIARASGSTGAKREADEPGAWKLGSEGTRSVGMRSGEAFAAVVNRPDARLKVDVVVDRSVGVTREALDVLLGAAFPGHRAVETDVAVAAAGGRETPTARTTEAAFALPLELSLTWEVGGETIHTSNRVVRVGTELPAAELIAIPPGARQVESPIVAKQKALEELDHLPDEVSRKP